MSNETFDLVLTAPEPVGKIETLFPELLNHAIVRHDFKGILDLNAHLMQQNSFAFRVTGGIVEDPLSTRILGSCARSADTIWKARIDALHKAHFPVVFISLRTHTRKWLQTPKEIADMFAAFFERHPTTALIFDGHSVEAGSDKSRHTNAESALIGDILKHLPTGFTCLTSAGETMANSIYAAGKSHIHLSAQGTSTTKAALIAAKPGVVIGSRQFGWDVRAFRAPTPLLITPWEHAKDAKDNDIQCDYWLDTDVVLSGLFEVTASVS
jgi:hypothetical protein